MHLKSLLKNNALVIITFLLSFSVFAQAPNLLNYQGVARNSVGNPLPNQSMKLRLSIHDLLPSGAVVYSEIRAITTNLGGLFSVQIGSAGASSSTGTLGGVNWVVGNKFLQVELDPASNNNYIDIGTVQLVSVPYAFGAGSAATVKTNANLTGVVTSVGNQTSIANGAITSDMIGMLNKSKVGLDLVNNTSDAAKPISTATQAALGNKLNIADSSTGYVTPSQLATKTFDQTPITNAIAGKLAIADSTNGYVTPAKLATKTFDQTPITNAIAGKLNISDSTNGYVTPAQLASKTFDQTPITNAIAGKLSIADSTNGYVTPAQLAAKTFDTTSISNRINQKANTTSVNTALALKAPLASPTFSGVVAIGTNSPAPSAVLDITSTSQGLLLPRLTYAQKMAIVSPVAGLVFWCTDCGTSGEMQVYNGTAFVNMVGGVAQFSMPSIAATTGVYSITSSSATSGGEISSDGGAVVTARGIVWGTSTAPTIALVTKTTDGTGTGTYSSTITGLTPGVTYYLRAYATNSVGTKYGTEISFNTALAVPTLATTITASSIGATTAISGGNITYNGGAIVTVSGVVWSTTSTPTITLTTKTTNGAASGTYTSTITGLTPGTLYYVRSYATNSIGTNYGAQISFTTLNTATISATASATSITSSTATSGGTITSDGGAAVTARGLVYGTSSGASTFSVTTGTGTGTYTSSLTGLSPATTYFVRAFATNSVGTVYGAETNFSTLAIAPSLTTTVASSITKYAASAGGTITSNGGSTITASGICWSTTATPTISDSKTTDGTTSETYSSTLIGLTAGTTYYLRAYATNAIGTGYGAAQSFTTSASSSNNPVLASTTSSTSITSNSATTGGNVTDEGATQVSARGLVYGTTTGSSTYSVTVGSGAGTFTSTLIGLTQGTKYFVRSFATNVQGTGYGAEVSFTTQTTATVSVTATPTSITTTTAIGGGTISSTGGATITTSGLVWDASVNPTITLSTKTTDGTTSGTFTSSITGLTQGTNYHVRAYATNYLGTSYGPDITFTTLKLSTVSATAIPTSIARTTAVVGGTVSVDGIPTATRGLVYGTSSGSSTYSVTVGSGAGTYTTTLTGLTAGTTYYVRSFATNSVGLVYGPEQTFTTVAAYSAPLIVTSGLLLNLDAASPDSYSGSGTTWTNLATAGKSMVPSFTINNQVIFNDGVFTNSKPNNLNIAYSTANSNFGDLQNYTIEMWVKISSTDDISASSTLFTQKISGITGAPVNFALLYNYNWGLGYPGNQFQLTHHYNGWEDVARSTSLLQSEVINNWVHVVGTFDLITKTFKIYKNGVEVASGSATYNKTPKSSGLEYEIGSYWSGQNAGKVYGDYSIVNMYNRALSPLEVTTNYNAVKSRFGL